MINSSCFPGRALVYCHSQQCMVCAEGPMGVTSSPPRLLHHEDWDRWCSCQSWRGRTSGKCVDLKQFSRSSRCCGLMSTVQRCFLVWSLWGNWGGIATVSFLEVWTKCFGRWRKSFWVTCQGLLISERASTPWKVNATTISQWYLIFRFL